LQVSKKVFGTLDVKRIDKSCLIAKNTWDESTGFTATYWHADRGAARKLEQGWRQFDFFSPRKNTVSAFASARCILG
jgi:hypothetical protein